MDLTDFYLSFFIFGLSTLKLICGICEICVLKNVYGICEICVLKNVYGICEICVLKKRQHLLDDRCHVVVLILGEATAEDDSPLHTSPRRGGF